MRVRNSLPVRNGWQKNSANWKNRKRRRKKKEEETTKQVKSKKKTGPRL